MGVIKYKTAKELRTKALQFIEQCKVEKELPEKAGLCVHLGITRDTYCRYRKQKNLSDTIKEIDHLIESAWVRRLGGAAPAGAIFYLKNAFKEHYKDKTETDVTTNGKDINQETKELVDVAINNYLNGNTGHIKKGK